MGTIQLCPVFPDGMWGWEQLSFWGKKVFRGLGWGRWKLLLWVKWKVLLLLCSSDACACHLCGVSASSSTAVTKGNQNLLPEPKEWIQMDLSKASLRCLRNDNQCTKSSIFLERAAIDFSFSFQIFGAALCGIAASAWGFATTLLKEILGFRKVAGDAIWGRLKHAPESVCNTPENEWGGL